MKTRLRSTPPILLLLLAGCAGAALLDPGDAIATLGAVQRNDPAIDALVPRDAVVEVLAEGFQWSEGPLWVDEDGGYVLFSDIPPNRVWKWQPGRGASVYLAQSGYLDPIPRPDHIAPDEPGSNGLLLDPQGRLVLCQHGLRQVGRMTAPLSAPRPEFEPIATHYNGRRFNSPNDAVYRSNGDLYFTDPPYGLTRKMQDPEKEIGFQGVYRVTPAGDVTLLTDAMTRPNGIAFSPDERTLYVANSDPQRAIWMAFGVRDDGTLGPGRVLFDATSMVPELPGLPDGLAIDRHGNLFATGPGGVLVLTPDGRHLGTILTGRPTSNCTFGDDGSTLYVTADEYLLRVRLTTTGAAAAARPLAGEICFTTNRDGDYEIYVMAADGSSRQNCSDHEGLDFDSSWSPDGRLAFRSDRDGNPEIFVADRDGSNPVNLTRHAARDAGPDWSPDGRRIVFVSDRDQARREIYTMAADGGDVRRLTDNALYEEAPSWSPDGEWIAFARQIEEPADGHAGNAEIFVMRRDGSDVQRLTRRPGFDSGPAWSPDGRRIAFHGQAGDHWDLFVMDRDGGDVRNLTADAAEDYQPQWSPDGEWIVYCSGERGEYDLWLIRPDSSARRRLTSDAGREQNPDWRRAAR